MQKTLAINGVLALAQAVQVDAQSEAELQAAIGRGSEPDGELQDAVKVLQLAQQYRPP